MYVCEHLQVLVCLVRGLQLVLRVAQSALLLQELAGQLPGLAQLHLLPVHQRQQVLPPHMSIVMSMSG